MGTKLETLQEKLTKLQEQIGKEELKVQEETAIAVVRDSFADAIMVAVAATEKESGKSLREIGLGIWIAYPDGDGNGKVHVSALAVGTDGLPKALKRSSNGHANGNGESHGHGNGNGSEYFLKDGRGPFAGTLEALDAMGFTGERGKYYHRHDRLPKELQEQIIKRAKAETPETETPPETPETAKA